MPTEKKWVVDEKGFHAVNQTTSQSSNSNTSNVDDSSTQNATTEEPQKAISLQEGVWIAGDEGFTFNKKCTVQITGKYLGETTCKKVTIDTFVEYEGEEEDLKQSVDAFLNDDCVAEAEVTLFYGEKYGNALGENPDAKCNYLFRAKSDVAESELESEMLEMPSSVLGSFIIRLAINPENNDAQDDTYKLKSTDNNKIYEKILTVENDKIVSDDYLDLEFTEIDESLSYTLEINPGNEGDPYYLFESIPFLELKNGNM